MSKLPVIRALVLLVALPLTVAACGEATSSNSAGSGDSPAPSQTTAEKKAPALPKLGTWARAKSELRDKFEGGRIRKLTRDGKIVVLRLKADDNLTNGLIKSGMKHDAQDAFRQVFKDAAYHPPEMLVWFYFPLVEKATGKEGSRVVAVYALTRGQAVDINWANEDSIDWDIYRTLLHPALD
jgi:hypothetical protein